jgi:hypothetical protein
MNHKLYKKHAQEDIMNLIKNPWLYITLSNIIIFILILFNSANPATIYLDFEIQLFFLGISSLIVLIFSASSNRLEKQERWLLLSVIIFAYIFVIGWMHAVFINEIKNYDAFLNYNTLINVLLIIISTIVLIHNYLNKNNEKTIKPLVLKSLFYIAPAAYLILFPPWTAAPERLALLVFIFLIIKSVVDVIVNK